jgi:Zn-dependent protease
MVSMEDIFLKISIMLVPGLMAITGHELAHGLIAFQRGDDTAFRLGRLTLNPLKHIDFVGMLLLFLIGIGWAKPVPVDFSKLRNPKRDMIWVAAAGPVTNFLLALLCGGLLRLLYRFGDRGLQELNVPILLMLAFGVFINLVLAIFNMLPIPPMDGGRVMVGILPHQAATVLSRVEPYGMIGILMLVVLFPAVLSKIIVPPLYTGLSFIIGPEIMDHLRGLPVFHQLKIFPF